MVEPRFYREQMNGGRFKSFTCKYLETDIWVGVDEGSYRREMKNFVIDVIKKLRNEIEEFMYRDKRFRDSISPYDCTAEYEGIVKEMFRSACRAGVGPMASVAGAFAREVGNALESEYRTKEVLVENGGDIYLKIMEPAVMSIYAGESEFSNRIGLKIKPDNKFLGVCTSSSTVGHSLSYGMADAVVVICRDVILADAYATSYCNEVKKEEDIERILLESKKVDEILGMVVVMNEKMGIRGKYEVC